MSNPPTLSPATLRAVSDGFEGQPPEVILRWGLEHFAPQIALATAFGPEGVALMHLLTTLDRTATVFYLDTDLFFPETYALRDQLQERLGVTFTRVTTDLALDAQAAEYGPALWARDPDQCCRLRKVEPLRRYLATQQAWISAIRRDQTPQRANAGLVEWDAKHGLVKLNPLANWTHDDVWAYLYLHDLPTNPLHAQGYPSIGCWPCTHPVAAGADPRSGRWAGSTKTECGIHTNPNNNP